jgi:hypothetical protein
MIAGTVQAPSSRRSPFTFLDNCFASSPALAALSAHSAFGFCAYPETNTPDYDPDPRGRAFLYDSASFRARFLNDVVVREGRRNHQNCQSGTGQNCSHEKSPLSYFSVELDPRRGALNKRALERRVPEGMCPRGCSRSDREKVTEEPR